MPLREIAEKIKDDPDFGHFELDIVGNCEDEPDPESRAGLEYIANKIERTIEASEGNSLHA